MKRIAILTILLIALMSNSSQAQWKMLFHYPIASELSTNVVYFLDLPGSPKIGFIGNEGYGFMKTTDGGQTWKPLLTAPWPTDIAFKDSSTGWMVNDGFVYETTDCGETWKMTLPQIQNFDDGIYYDKTSDGLFISGQLPVTSWDEGITWNNPNTLSLQGYSEGFAFNNGDTGILSSPGNNWYLTTDGGHTWNEPTAFNSAAWQPLAIPGTTTQFAITSEFGTVFRSDDYWKTWDTLYQFPYRPDHYGFASSGCIRGDTFHLFVQTIDGCFMSTDQGHTWQYLCGVPTPFLVGNTRFYTKYPFVYLQSTDQIWMLNVDSIQYFGINMALPDSTKSTVINKIGDTVTINFSANQDQIGIDSGHIVIRFNSDALGLKSLQLPPSWVILDSSSKNGVLDLHITADSNAALPSPIITLTFNTYLSTPSTKVYLDSAHLYGKRLNCDCQALSIVNGDSVEVDFTGCGDSLLLAAMEGKLQLIINGITPNPFSQSTQITLTSESAGYADISVVNLLGEQVSRVFSGELDAGLHNFTFDNTANLPDGMYECLVRMNGRVEKVGMVLLH